MSEENGGASEFLSESVRQKVEWNQASQAAFEATCVRAVAKRFDLRHTSIADRAGQPEDTPLTFGLLDLAYPGLLAVRLGSERIKSRKMSEKRKTSLKGFHELTPEELFGPSLMRTQLVFRWRELRDDGVLDCRPVGLVFPYVSTPYVVHNKMGGQSSPGTRLVHIAEGSRGHGDKVCDDLVIEPLLQLLSQI